MRVLALAVLVVSVVGCGEGVDLGDGAGSKSGGSTIGGGTVAQQPTPPAAPVGCQQMSGTYLVKYGLRSGNCGGFPEYVVDTNDSSNGGSSCTGGVSVSADRCSASVNMTCPSGNLIIKFVGKLDINLAGTTASGIIGITADYASGGLYCTGTYLMSYTKL
jgi:hypothetical protein